MNHINWEVSFYQEESCWQWRGLSGLFCVAGWNLFRIRHAWASFSSHWDSS